MDGLSIDFTNNRKVGKEMTKDGDDFISLINTINNINSKLSEADYIGDDGKKYSEGISNNVEDMKKMGNILIETGDKIVKATEIIERTKDDLAGQISW